MQAILSHPPAGFASIAHRFLDKQAKWISARTELKRAIAAQPKQAGFQAKTRSLNSSEKELSARVRNSSAVSTRS